jgi:molybdate transport system ATP-binding protein
MDHAASGTEGRGVIEIRLELPLARFALQLDLRLGTGVTALMGPSGSGKTSLLEALAGLRQKARGVIRHDDVTWLDSGNGVLLAPEGRRVGYVPQDAGLFPHLTALGNVRFGARGDGAATDTAIDILEIRGLLDRYPASLSGGERQRVALARALATGPRLLLLDEPLASLDPARKSEIMPYLVRLRDKVGIPMVYVSHYARELKRFPVVVASRCRSRCALSTSLALRIIPFITVSRSLR